MTIDEAIEQACANVGVLPPRRRAFGKWLTTDTDSGRNGKGDGRVIINDQYVTAWNWQTGEKSTVGLQNELSQVERQAVARDISFAQAKARKDAEKATKIAEALVANATTATHPYLVAKGFRDEPALVVAASFVREVVGSYIVPDAAHHAIVIPARIGGKVVSAQLIWEDGTKKFVFGGKMGGASHRISTGADTWLVEGYATGLSVRAALRGLKMRATVLCCFSASNIVAVAKETTGRRVFVAADNDRPLPQYGDQGAGEYFAKQTGLSYGMPPTAETDFNDMHEQQSIFAVQRSLTSIMARRCAA